MNTHIEQAEKCLLDNNQIGMSSSLEPIHWNLQNAVAALIKGIEEENRKLKQQVALLESQIRNMR